MYKIAVGDNLGKLQAFLTVNDTEYIDVIIKDSTVLFVTNVTEVMGLLSLVCSKSANSGDVNFRVKRSLLKNLAGRGGMEISISEGYVSVTFLDTSDSVLYQAKFIHQPVFNSAYVQKLSVLRGIQPDTYFDLRKIIVLNRIAKLFGTPINVTPGVGCVIGSSNVRVYRELDTQDTFCVSPRSFEMLRKCGYKAYSIENYLYTFDDNFAVLVLKSRSYSNDEYFSLATTSGPYKSKYVASVALGSVLFFLMQQKIKPKEASISVTDRCCRLVSDDVEYCIPVKIFDERIAEGAVFEEFSIPYSVIENILFPLKETTFEVRRKKSFLQMSVEDYSILFN